MCAIVDANVTNEVFGDNRTQAGKQFFDWLSSPRGQLVIGGRLRIELGRDRRFIRWLEVAIRTGRAHSVSDQQVNDRENELKRRKICTSNDVHVLALALVSGARLLYTNDAALIADFRNREIVANPRGKVYTTGQKVTFTTAHKQLLTARGLCLARPPKPTS